MKQRNDQPAFLQANPVWKRYLLIWIGFLLGTILLCPLGGISQTKKKQIRRLSLRIDSLNQQIHALSMEQTNQITLLTQKAANDNQTIDSLGRSIRRMDSQIKQLQQTLVLNNEALEKIKNAQNKLTDSVTKLNATLNELRKSKLSGDQYTLPATQMQHGNNEHGKRMIMRGRSVGADEYLELVAESGESWSPEIREIHVIPDPGALNQYETYDANMLSFLSYFDFFDASFARFSGLLSVFYDTARTKLAGTVFINGNQMNGNLLAYHPDGTLMLDHQYSNGKCVSIRKDIAEWNWRFDNKKSSLTIPATSTFIQQDESNNPLIILRPPIYDANEYGALDQLIEKPVYRRVFLVNGLPFTGTLQGYFRASSPVSQPYFTLRFKGGRLHGIITIYQHDGFESIKMLEEKFVNGVLVKTLFKAEEADGMAKPVIYLYPEKKETVQVQLTLKGRLTHSYPAYRREGWRVLAAPDGTLTDSEGQTYYALFWEGINSRDFTYDSGFVIKGTETVRFLEQTLSTLGLSRREANEFIMYWLPQMENNPFNLIHFASDEYEQEAALTVVPQPKTRIRVMMVWSPLSYKIVLPEQDIRPLCKERSGFTVVEWGGKKQPWTCSTKK
jgi:hypothetical protein